MTATLRPGAGTPAPSTNERLERELQATMELVDQIRQAVRRDDLPGWVWLRAGRACWLTDNLDWARDMYRRAALALTQYAMDVGRRSGTFEQYAFRALGAAWACGQREVLTDCGRQIDVACEQMLTSLELPPEPLIRVGLLLTRMRVAWLREQSVLIREYETELERRVNALDAWAKASWQSERGLLSAAAIRAFTSWRSAGGRLPPPGQPSPLDGAKTALQALDRRLVEERSKPPSIADLVDEELLSFVSAMEVQNARLPVLRMPIRPGSRGI